MNHKVFTIAITLIICFSFSTGILSAEEKSYVETHYSKKEYRIPMRDGATLFTAVYSPRDSSVKYPFLIHRSPYSSGPYGQNNYIKRRVKTWHHLAKEKFIFVFQDVRGRFMSDGEFVNMRPYIVNKKSNKDIDETTDTFDTVAWLVKNVANNNGKAGLLGISYPGFYAAMGTIDAHPALKAVSPQAPISDWFKGDDWHHNGSFCLAAGYPFLWAFDAPRTGLTKSWPSRYKFPTQDGYQFYLDMGPVRNAEKNYFKGHSQFWNKLMEHGTYDQFWKDRSSLPHFNNVSPAVMVVGGWFDAENVFGAVETYRAIEKLSPNAENIVVLGPWFHGGWVRSDGGKLGDVSFKSKTGEYYVKNLELPFFKYHLKGVGQNNLPEASIFETGSNQWKTYDQWPPANATKKKLFLGENYSVSFKEPENMKIVSHEYTSDPAKPVPFTSQIATGVPKSYMVEDQRFASRRTDVLVYKSDVIEEELTISGPLEVEIYVSTSGTASDWVVKLIDVFPGKTERKVMSGYEMLLRGDMMRGKFRNSLEKPEAMVPGKITRIKFKMPDLAHTFKKGHRIMVHIQSSWFPLFDRNPQTFTDIYKATEKDFKKAVQRVYVSKEYPSGIIVNVMR